MLYEIPLASKPLNLGDKPHAPSGHILPHVVLHVSDDVGVIPSGSPSLWPRRSASWTGGGRPSISSCAWRGRTTPAPGPDAVPAPPMPRMVGPVGCHRRPNASAPVASVTGGWPGNLAFDESPALEESENRPPSPPPIRGARAPGPRPSSSAPWSWPAPAAPAPPPLPR